LSTPLDPNFNPFKPKHRRNASQGPAKSENGTPSDTKSIGRSAKSNKSAVKIKIKDQKVLNALKTHSDMSKSDFDRREYEQAVNPENDPEMKKKLKPGKGVTIKVKKQALAVMEMGSRIGAGTSYMETDADT